MISESVLIWICSKLENNLFHNWNTPYRTVSISTTCWRKFVHFRFAEFCSVLKSIRGDGSLGLGNLLMTSEFWLTSPKQPFEISNSRNDTKKSRSALHLEKYRKVPNFLKIETNICNPLRSLAIFIHKIGLTFDNFKEQYKRNWSEKNLSLIHI